MIRTFRETSIFSQKLNAMVDDSLLRTIEDAILANPEAEDLTEDEKRIFKSLVAQIKGESR